MKIYAASSWRNKTQPQVVRTLVLAGHEVYDFRHPEPGNEGFHWSEIDPQWEQWSVEKFRQALNHPLAEDGFTLDLDAMRWADAFLLINPCGRSAHLELGWAIGAGKPSAILVSLENEPELMYKLADEICLSIEEVLEFFQQEEKKTSETTISSRDSAGDYVSPFRRKKGER